MVRKTTVLVLVSKNVEFARQSPFMLAHLHDVEISKCAQAAQSIGIPLNYIWVIVWTVAGLVALVAGVIWGSKLGVQFSLSLIALKALPVLILGGFESH